MWHMWSFPTSLQTVHLLFNASHTHFQASSLINMHMLLYTDADTVHSLALFHIFPAFLSSCISKAFPNRTHGSPQHQVCQAGFRYGVSDCVASVNSHFSEVELWQHKSEHSTDGQTENFAILDSVQIVSCDLHWTKLAPKALKYISRPLHICVACSK